jgi:predicted phosphodiesterase
LKINILSDLHLSLAALELPDNEADVVVLAGDIGRPGPAMEWARSLHKPVIYVAGNHEFYGGTLHGTIQELRHRAEGSMVCVLDDSQLCLGGVRFLGSTLWTDFLLFGDGPDRDAAAEAAVRSMLDFRRIFLDSEHQRLFTPLDAAALFRRHASWLREALEQPFAGPTVVVTHHAPSARSIEARYEGSLLNACFASNADELVQLGNPALWIHGHMHHSVDYTIGSTRVVSNPRGYCVRGINESPRFDPNFVVEIG